LFKFIPFLFKSRTLYKTIDTVYVEKYELNYEDTDKLEKSHTIAKYRKPYVIYKA